MERSGKKERGREKNKKKFTSSYILFSEAWNCYPSYDPLLGHMVLDDDLHTTALIIDLT